MVIIRLDITDCYIGFGHSRGPRVSITHARYMEELIKSLPIERPIVVSPSMSGDYFLPYVLHGKTFTSHVLSDLAMGF